MDKKLKRQGIVELERYVFGFLRPDAAAQMISEIVGVVGGLKPAMIGMFSEAEVADGIELDVFKEMVEALGLYCAFFMREYFSAGKWQKTEVVYIAREARLAWELKQCFDRLWATMDDFGQVGDLEAWQENTVEIGGLLGYPGTAIRYFVDRELSGARPDMAVMRRNRYYAHSLEFEDVEFQAFDLKLNRLVDDLAPMTAEVMRSNTEKRWLG